jgi:Aldehyde dehydrogenase family
MCCPCHSGTEFVDCGAMCLPGLAEEVHKLVEDARAKGARVLTGGKLLEGAGQFYPPTILADVTQDMLVWREETFGPLMTVARCSSDAHAVRTSSCTPTLPALLFNFLLTEGCEGSSKQQYAFCVCRMGQGGDNAAQVSWLQPIAKKLF